MVNPLKNAQFSRCQDFLGLGIFFQMSTLLWYATAIQVKKTYIERLEVACKNLEESVNAFERAIELEKKSWHEVGLALDKFKESVDFCVARLIQIMPTVDFKHDSQYFADLQCMYNQQAKWVKLRDGRALAQEKRKGAGGLSDSLIEKYEKLAEQKRDLELVQERLRSAKDELSRLEVEEAALQADVSRRAAPIKDVAYVDRMCDGGSYRDFDFTG